MKNSFNRRHKNMQDSKTDLRQKKYRATNWSQAAEALDALETSWVAEVLAVHAVKIKD
jgi:hypothetical protein